MTMEEKKSTQAKNKIIQYLVGESDDAEILKGAIQELLQIAPDELAILRHTLLFEENECQEFSELLLDYFALGEEAPSQLPEIYAHVQICNRCAAKLEALKEVQETQSAWEDVSKQIHQHEKIESQKLLDMLKVTMTGKEGTTMNQLFEIPYTGPFLKIIPERGRLKIADYRNIQLNVREKEKAQDIISATTHIKTESCEWDVKISISLIRNTYHLTLEPPDNVDPDLIIYCRLLQTLEDGYRDITNQITQQDRESRWNKRIVFDEPTELQFLQKEEDLSVDIGFTRMEDGEVQYYCGAFRVEIPKN